MADFKELGSTGLTRSGGVVDAEWLTMLKGAQGRKFYTEMRDNSPIVGAVLFSIQKMLQKLDWHVEPSDPDNPTAVEVSDFVETCLTDMGDSWDVTLTDVCSMFVYGWSWHEVVYKQRGGLVDDPTKRSKYTDGRIGWRKWAPRGQDTLVKFDWDEDGDVTAMHQADASSGKGVVVIPIEKSLLFRFNPLQGNPEGRSLLRTAAVPYFYQKRVREIEAIGIERDLAGLPVAWVPGEWLSSEASAAEQSARDAVTAIVAGIKRNEQEGVVLPHTFTESGQSSRTVDLQLLSTGGARQFDTDKIIARYSQEIAMSVLMDFLLLGHEAVGSKALSVSKMDLWLMSVDAVARHIADTVSTHAIPKLVLVNGWPAELSPSMAYGSVDRFDAEGMAEALERLLASGVVMPDEALDDWARDVFGLPARDETLPDAEPRTQPDDEVPDEAAPDNEAVPEPDEAVA
jgi:hypothetical protein